MSPRASVRKCNCGNRGCFEALASRGAIFRKIRAAVDEGGKTVLTAEQIEDVVTFLMTLRDDTRER